MINPKKLLKLKPEKELFVKRHSDLVQFLEMNFGGEIQDGDELTIIYSHVDGEEESITVTLTEEDVQVIQTISKLF